MTGHDRRQLEMDAARRVAAIARGATLLLVVSIVVSGSPLQGSHEAARVDPARSCESLPGRAVTQDQSRVARSLPKRVDQERPSMLTLARRRDVVAASRAPVPCTSQRIGVIGAPVRVALTDLPPPAC